MKKYLLFLPIVLSFSLLTANFSLAKATTIVDGVRTCESDGDCNNFFDKPEDTAGCEEDSSGNWSCVHDNTDSIPEGCFEDNSSFTHATCDVGGETYYCYNTNNCEAAGGIVTDYSAPGIVCSSIADATACASTPGCYYYSGGCHDTPATGGGANVRCSDTEINTAIGCIPFGSTKAFMNFVLSWAFGIGGGLAFLLIVVAGFQIITSSGDPKKLQAGKELLTSAIAGLVLLVLSTFLLRVIGVNILGIFELE